MQTAKLKVKQWGNSVGILIPKGVAAAIGLQINTEVYSRYGDSEFIVHPIPLYDMAALLKDVTADNLPDEDWDVPTIDFGPFNLS